MRSILLALTVASGLGTRFDSDLPPARFQGNATATVQFDTDSGVSARCEQSLGPANPGHHWGGCHLTSGVIIFPNPCLYTDQPYAGRLCHELGHWNGWPGDHPR